MNTTIPKWIMVIAAIFALAAFAISFQLLESEGLAYAARNVIPGVLTLATLLFFRSSVVAFILIFVGRMTMEIGDLITGLTNPGSAEAGMVPMVAVMIVIEAVAIYVLSKRLAK